MQTAVAHRPYQSWLVDRMKPELRARLREYVEDRERAHNRLATVVKQMHGELFEHRSTDAASRLLSEVDVHVTQLGQEWEALQQLRKHLQIEG